MCPGVNVGEFVSRDQLPYVPFKPGHWLIQLGLQGVKTGQRQVMTN
jgi:hypothetical protein